jgi:guanylate kinase
MFIVITGPSGCGKSTLARRMLSEIENLEFSVSYTTREKRETESEGQDYHFVSEDKFKRMIRDDMFIEWAVVHGNYYGTSKKALEEKNTKGDLLLDIDVQGAEQVREKIEGAVFVFILPPLFPALKKRLERRAQDSPPVIEQRLEKAKEEIEHYREFDYIVINDDLDLASEELKSVIISQRCRREIREKDILPILHSFIGGN